MVGRGPIDDDGPVTARRLFFRIGWAIHRAMWRLSGHRIGTAPAGPDGVGTLFLLSTGRRSGAIRRNGLYYVEDGASFAVVASNAGDDADPQWWRNLQATPASTIELGATAVAVRAREATDGERDRIWPRFVAKYPVFADYRSRTTRAIPVVILEPRG